MASDNTLLLHTKGSYTMADTDTKMQDTGVKTEDTGVKTQGETVPDEVASNIIKEGDVVCIC